MCHQSSTRAKRDQPPIGTAVAQNRLRKPLHFTQHTLFSLVRFCDEKEDDVLHVFLRQVCVIILILNILYSNQMHKSLTKIKIKLSNKNILLLYKSLEENVVV